MRFTGNDRGIRRVIAMLAVLFVLMAAGYCRRSEADELSVGFGVALAGSERCFESMTIMQEFGEGRWLGYLATHGNSPSCRAEQEPIRANVGAGVIRTAHADRWTLGFGAGLLEHGDVVIGPDSILGDDAPRTADRPQLAAAILVRLRIRERLVLDLLHNSTGGSTGFNRGLNTITLGWRVP